MTLRMFSIIGESLNFGGRRLELIARVAWLPILLLLIVDMATTFASLSVIAGQTITFADVKTMFQAKQYFAQYAERGWTTAPDKMAAIAAVNVVLNVILLSSFMAPLIRYAGLGERPGPGLFRLPFGADQVRFIIAGLASALLIFAIAILPAAAAGFYVMKYIVEAMSQTMASFPDPDSLHTIELVTAGKAIADSGAAWVYDFAIPLAAAAPFAVIVWILAILHFHPKNRPNAGEGGNIFLRTLVVLIIAAGLVGSVYLFLRGAAMQSMTQTANTGNLESFTGAPVNALLIFAALSFILVAYFNLRLFPWPGVAVCRRSLALGQTLQVTRGWNLIRLPLIVAVIAGFLLTAVIVINVIILPMAASTLNVLFQATETSTRLVNSGVKGDWVLPLFIWIWNFFKIAVNFLWTFFSYGVIAALYGRLYRESEQSV